MLSRNLALLAAFSLAFVLFRDAARAAAPRTVEIEDGVRLPVPFGEPNGLTVDGHRVYLANGAGGLVILDAVDPLHPTVVGRFLTGSPSSPPPGAPEAPGVSPPPLGSEESDLREGLAVRVAASEKSVFLLTGSRWEGHDFSRVLNLDVSDPAGPHVVAQICLSGRPRGLAALGPTRVCVVVGGDSEQGGNLTFADLSGTTGARLVTSLPYPSADSDTYVDLAYAQQTLLICGSDAGGPGHADIVDCDEPDRPSPEASLTTRGTAQGVALSATGLVGYVADGEEGLALLDLSNRQSPRLLETPVAVEGAALHISLSRKTLLVTTPAGLIPFDVSNSVRPEREASIRTAFVPGAAAFGEGYAAAIVPARGVAFFRLGTGAGVGETRLVATAGSPPRVRRHGEDLYAALGTGGCVHYSLHGSDAPTPLGNLELAPGSKGEVRDMEPVNDRTFWTASEEAGILVSALTGSFAARVGASVTGGGARALAVEGTRVYAVTNGGELRVYDGSDGHRPVLLGETRWTQGKHSSGCAVAVAGSRAYVAAGAAGLAILDVSDPRAPRLSGELAADPSGPLRIVDVAVTGKTAFLVDEGRGLLCVDVTDSAHPRLLARYQAAGACSIDLSGNQALLAEGTLGLEVLDVADPAQPVSAGVFRGPGLRFASAVWGPTGGSEIPIYAGDCGFVRTLRLRVDHSPRGNRAEWVTSVPVPGLTGVSVGSAVDQHRLLLAGSDYQLFSIDLTRGGVRSPHIRSAHPAGVSPSGCAGFAVEGGRAYLWDAAGSLSREMDLPDAPEPFAPPPTRSAAPAGTGRLLFGAVRGRTLYQPAGGRVLDLGDAQKPALLGECPGQGGGDAASALTSVHGEAYWLIANTVGLKVLDVNDLAHPRVVGTASLPRDAGCRGIEATGARALVLARDELCFVDLSDPHHPRQTAGLALPGIGYDLRVDGNRVYVACGTNGVEVVDIRDPSQPYPIQILRRGGNPNPPDYRLLEIADGNLYAVNSAPAATTVEVWKLASRSR